MDDNDGAQLYGIFVYSPNVFIGYSNGHNHHKPTLQMVHEILVFNVIGCCMHNFIKSYKVF